MIRFAPSALLIASALTPLPALAQSGDADAMRAQITGMRAEIERLSAEVEKLSTAQANAVQPSPVAVVAPAKADPVTEIAWKGAPEIEGPGGWSFKPRGRLMFDAGSIGLPDNLPGNDGFGSEVRRARLGFEGDMPGGFGYKFEVDFAGGDAELADAIITYGDGALKVAAGHHNTFQSLEELTSSRFSSFMERAAFTDAFGFERRVGLSAQYKTGIVLMQAGLFTDNSGDLPGDAWSADGRIVLMPKVGNAQLHLGASVHHTDLPSGDEVRYRQRPLVHFTGDRFINTGSIDADSELGYGAEAAIISGPFHAVGEIFRQEVAVPGASNPGFTGGYAEAGFFLTGESRGYKSGVFDRTKPANPVGKGGLGAFQVNVRYDYLDLSDDGIAGGTQDGYQASLIWIPTAYTRLTLNYGRLEYTDAAVPLTTGERDYGVDVIGLRTAIDF